MKRADWIWEFRRRLPRRCRKCGRLTFLAAELRQGACHAGWFCGRCAQWLAGAVKNHDRAMNAALASRPSRRGR